MFVDVYNNYFKNYTKTYNFLVLASKCMLLIMINI